MTKINGPLAGVKVVHSSMSVAGPTCCQLMAEWGADVVWIESPFGMDVTRSGSGLFAEQDRRNERSLCLNIPTPEGKRVLLDLLKDADIFLEASKGGQYEKWGLSDEVLWEANPSLVIIHVSGFGQTGVPEYVKRPSYDPIAQAFGCYMAYNGEPGRSPIPAGPQTADYITGLLACSAGLAALTRARATGEGESVDIAQYEALIRFLNRYPIDYFNEGIRYSREGGHNLKCAGFGLFPCKDGVDIYICFLGTGVYKRGCAFLDLPYGSDAIPEGTTILAPGSEGGKLVEDAVVAYARSVTAKEAEIELNKIGIPAQRVMDLEDAEKDPQYLARETFTEWQTIEGRTVKGVNVVPKFKSNPGVIWRGAPSIGGDNEEVLRGIGYDDEAIEALYASDTLAKR